MNNERNNTLIGFMQCNSNANYRMHNWAQVLTRECPEAAKHAISFILKEGYKISFIFNDSFEILANNTVFIFDKLYNVTENIINDANIPSFIGFNTTEDCIVNANFETNLRNFTSQALQATIQAGSISNSFIASGEETTDLNTRNCDDTIATASFTSFISETALTFCCLLLSLLAILKIHEYCKNSKTMNQSDTYYLPIKKITEKEIEYQGNKYTYDVEQDIWTPCLGSDYATYHA